MKRKLRMLVGITITSLIINYSFYNHNITARAYQNKLTYVNKIEKVDKPHEVTKDCLLSETEVPSEPLARIVIDSIYRTERQLKDNVIKTLIEEKIKNDIGNNENNIGISYFDINSGTYIGINDGSYFTAGSTVKVAIGMVISDMIEKGDIEPTETLMYNDSFYENGAGVLQCSNLLDSPIPISDLMGYMIKDSDNISTNMLISRIDYYKMKDKFAEILGHSVDKNSNSITAKEAYTYLLKLYENKDSKETYENLKNLMKTTTTHDRIDKYVPQELVAHKIGDYGGFVNDIGIVYGDSPYILTIYTKDISNSNELIAKISKDIYDIQLIRQNKKI